MSTYFCDGLDHLEGETVSILADGVVYDNQVVENGRIDADEFSDAEQVHIGLAFDSELQPMKPVVNTSMGTSVTSIVGCHKMGMSLLDSDGVQYGTDTGDLHEVNIDDVTFKNKSEKTGLFSGVVDVSVAGGYNLDNNIRIFTNAPLPCVVRALIPKMDNTGD